MAELKPTPHRLEVARAIDNGEVYTYDWSARYWRKRGEDEQLVTRQVLAMLQATPQLADLGTEPDAMDRWYLRLNDDGRDWLKRNEGLK
jgi:hypothetical protein